MRLQSDQSSQPVDRRRYYTFGDAFCGAGGTFRGAKGAMLKVLWGFDYNPATIESFAKNFMDARC